MLNRSILIALCFLVLIGSSWSFGSQTNIVNATGTQIAVLEALTTPTIDGVIDNSYRKVFDISPNTAGLVLGQGGIDFPAVDLTGTNNVNVNAQGLSARVYYAWDNNNLYFISKCTDKTIQSVSGPSYDYLATDNRLYFKSGGTIKAIKFINTTSGIMAMSGTTVLPNVVSTIKLENTIYTNEYSIEAKIPWTEIGITLAQAKNDFRMNFVQTSSKSTTLVNSVVYSKYNYFGTSDDNFENIKITEFPSIDGVRDGAYTKIFDFTPNSAGLVLGQGGVDFPDADLTGTNNLNVNAQGLSAKAYFTWDNNNLYFFSDCTDNTIQDVSSASYAYLATDNRLYLKSGSTIKNINFIITTGGSIATSNNNVLAEVLSCVVVNGNQYSFEAKIPWSSIGITKSQADADFWVNFAQTSSKSTSVVNSVISAKYNCFGTTNSYFSQMNTLTPTTLRAGAYHIAPNMNYNEFIAALDYNWINTYILEGAEPTLLSDALNKISQKGKKAFVSLSTALTDPNMVLKSDWQIIFNNIASICNNSPGAAALEGWYYDEPLNGRFSENDFITVTSYGKNNLNKRNLVVYSVPEFDKGIVNGNCPEINDTNLAYVTDVAYDSYDASLLVQDKVHNSFISKIQNRKNDIKVWYIPPIGKTFDVNWCQYYNIRILEQYLNYMKQDINVGGAMFYTWEQNMENGLTEGNGKYYLLPQANGVTPWNSLEKSVKTLGADIVQGKTLNNISFTRIEVTSASTAPTIDGVRDSSYIKVFNYTPAEAGLVYGQGGDFPVGDLTGTNNAAVAAQGLSAKVYYTYNSSYLYFISECTDNTIKAVTSTNYAHLATDNRLFFKSGSISKQINFINTTTGSKAISNGTVITTITSKIKVSGTKYYFEARIPWTTLGITLAQAKNEFKLDFAQTSSRSTTVVNSVISSRYNYFGTTSEYFDLITVK